MADVGRLKRYNRTPTEPMGSILTSTGAVVFIMKTKQELRQIIRTQRCQLNAAQQEHAAKLLFQQFIQSGLLGYYQKIGLYYSHSNEIDPKYITQHAWQSGKQCYLPVIADNSACVMACNSRNSFNISPGVKW